MPVILNLNEKITRYAAYQELRELWQNGIITIERIQPQYVSKADIITLNNLTVAVELIDRRLLELASFDREQFDLRRTVDGIPKSGDSIPLSEREEVARIERENKNAALLNGTAKGDNSGRDMFS